MEIIAGLLAILAGLGGSAGLLADRLARNAFMEQLDRAEILEVRIQSVPNAMFLGGRIDRILLAGRGLEVTPYPRIQLLELESEPLQVGLNNGTLELNSPLQVALRLELTETDLNASLQSPEVLEDFKDIEANVPVFGDRDGPEVFDLENPTVELLGQNRLQLKARLVLQSKGDAEEDAELDEQALDIDFTTSIIVEEGQRVLLKEPAMMLNDAEVPEEIADAFAGGIGRVLDAALLEDRGILVRLLDLKISEDAISAVGWVQLESLDLGS